MGTNKGKLVIACVVKDGKTSKFSSPKLAEDIDFKANIIDFGDIFVKRDGVSMLDIEYTDGRVPEITDLTYSIAITFKSGKTSMVRVKDKGKFVAEFNTPKHEDLFQKFETERGFIFINMDDISVIDFVNV
jgi:hypothetical protein